MRTTDLPEPEQQEECTGFVAPLRAGQSAESEADCRELAHEV